MNSDTTEETVPKSRIARKSTGKPSYVTRRQRQAAKNAIKALHATSDSTMANANPETSGREKRKPNRKINPSSNVRRPVAALYDENGVHIKTRTDLCDCLNEECEGCFFDCPKCGSQKCGPECRVHRKYVVDEIQYDGYDHTTKNTIQKR